MEPKVLEPIESKKVSTKRYEAHYLKRDGGEENIVLVHGNVSSSHLFQSLMLELDAKFTVYAPDLRGFGLSEKLDVDATRGVRDFSDDIASFMDALGLQSATILGWSLGGGVVMDLMQTRPDLVGKVILEAPVSPFGFGGTNELGELLNEDASGTGGAAANPDFIQRLSAGDFSADEQTSPRSVYRGSYVKNAESIDGEDIWIQSMLTTATGDGNYPGTSSASAHWPNFGPGEKGVLNSLSPKYFNTAGITKLESKPPILWIRGQDDAIVNDASFFDINYLGQLGIIPGWPGEQEAPAQKMISQTRLVLSEYAANGGHYQEVALEDCGHSPHLEKTEEVARLISQFA
jgi:pimeloyl-ACP methyl ester carboxylesterase